MSRAQLIEAGVVAIVGLALINLVPSMVNSASSALVFFGIFLGVCWIAWAVFVAIEFLTEDEEEDF